MTPLTPEGFRDAIRKGLGRARLRAQEHSIAGLEEIVLDACVHNYCEEPIFEGGRAWWLLEIIEYGEDVSYYQERIIAAATTATDYWDIIQLCYCLLYFAEAGSSDARTALYQNFDRQLHSDSWAGGLHIIMLDGIEGMLHVAEVVGARMMRDETYNEHDSMIERAGKQCGKEEVLEALNSRAKTSAEVRTYLERVSRYQQKWDAGINGPPPMTIENILAEIEAKTPARYPSARYRLKVFGNKATENDIELLFENLLAEQRLPQLLRYLWLFSERAVPRLAPRLFDLAASEDLKIRQAALEALSNVRHPDVRSLATHILVNSDAAVLRQAIETLAENYEPGDAAIVTDALGALADRSDIHDVGFAVLDFARRNQNPDTTVLLLWLYDNTPCSYCRQRAIDLLIERDEASKELLEECRWDCSTETRKLAEEALGRGG